MIVREDWNFVSGLDQLPIGQTATIEELALPESVEHHLMHMGFSPEARVTAVRRAPAGDPTVYAVDGMEIALRRETARGILVRAEDVHAPSGAASRGRRRPEVRFPALRIALGASPLTVRKAWSRPR